MELKIIIIWNIIFWYINKTQSNICEYKLILRNTFDIFLYVTISNKTKFCVIWRDIKIHVSKIDYTIIELSHEIISENIYILIHFKK